jgi:hypothetical protein
MLFGAHFGPFAEEILAAGKRPAVWGDMFVAHPTALEYLPKETIIFDWQYFSGPVETAKQFLDAGHEVVVCPTLITYAAPWLHLPQGELNVTEHAQAAEELSLLGVCVTTWEKDPQRAAGKGERLGLRRPISRGPLRPGPLGRIRRRVGLSRTVGATHGG